MRAFKLLMETVHIPGSNADIRIAIEVAFEQLREKLEAEDADDKDDTVHGGKSQGRLEEELSANREKWQNQTTNDNPEAISNMEEAKAVAEEKTDKISEFLQKHEQVEQIEIQQNEREAPSQKEETSVQKKTEPVKEKIQEIKVENNASDEKSERNLDILKETKTYNNGIVSPLLYEHKMTDNAKSFMDEVITDNAVKSKGDVAERNPLENEKSVWETSPVGDVSNEKSKNINKDAYLYDEMLTNDRGDTAQNGKVAANKQEAEDLRVPLQVDITLDQENEIRREINRSMSIEAIQAFYESQAEAMREQLTIASAELGIDAPVEIIGKQKSTKIEQPSAVSNRK